MALTQINGRVYDASSNRGIEEVSVSNADSIARTDADGRYSLAIEPQQDRYVFISVPEGYRPQERFYALIGDEPIGESLDFSLIPAPERAQGTFRLAHVSDTTSSMTTVARSRKRYWRKTSKNSQRKPPPTWSW